MKKNATTSLIIVGIVLILVSFYFGFKLGGNNEKVDILNDPNNIFPPSSYETALSKIEEGNNYVIENDLDDSCFPYRYFHRGCYYSQEKHYLVASTLSGSEIFLTQDERITLCKKFAHKGAVAYCLKGSAESEKCLEFAGTNDYLKRICNLSPNEVIPSQLYGPYNYSNCYPKGCENLPSGSCTDKNCMSQGSIEPVKYSDLK